MAWKEIETKRKYQREWCARRRFEFFKDKKCIKCNSKENLELDHVDPSKKVTHRIWSFSLERREAEVSKCQILCVLCHREKSKIDIKKIRESKLQS